MNNRNPWEERFNGIMTFITVVEAGSFSGAAFRMNLTRSAITKSIAKLEKRLGIKLFHRTTRQQTLTHEGGLYYEHCLGMYGNLNALESELRDGQVGPEGKIRISCPVLFGRRCVAPVLRSLTRTHPHIQIETELSDRVVDVLVEGFDLAIRVGMLADSTALIGRKITEQHMAIFASPEYLQRHGTPVSIHDLHKHRGILYGRSGKLQPWIIRDDNGQFVDVYPPSNEVYDDLQVIADSAIEGGGLAWLPDWLGSSYLANNQLSLVMGSQRVKSVDIYVIWPKTQYLPHRIRLLIDSLVEQVPLLIRQ
ncbi:LysR family transcriptional regulator [Pokkaliibacter sp. CJK22405]|uniref:LysR family transcriptional regulator n=1 Tax=Pokkaliibacter sp. CJK22405 TaxID=3384615 RepID=UPI003984AFB6